MFPIKCKNISFKSSQKDSNDLILDNINLEIEPGDFLIILGKSGSGKTTLLNIIVGLLQPTSGDVFINNENITNMSEDQKTYWRRYYFGYIFQNYGLINVLSSYDNIKNSLDLNSVYSQSAKKYIPNYKSFKCDNSKELINDVMDKLKISNLKNKFPHELSGGQQQRVSIARILVKKPEVIFCDEPTGALDNESSIAVMNMILEMNISNSTVVMITHNENFIKYANKVIRISNGKIIDSFENNNSVLKNKLLNINKNLVNSKNYIENTWGKYLVNQFSYWIEYYIESYR